MEIAKCQKVYSWWCLVACVLALWPVGLSAQPQSQIVISSNDLQTLLNDITLLKTALKNSKLSLNQAQAKQQQLLTQAKALQQSLQAASAESTELYNSLSALNLAYESYRLAAEDKIKQLQTSQTIIIIGAIVGGIGLGVAGFFIGAQFGR